MDTPSTSVSGAMGRSTKKKKVPKWKVSDNPFDGRDSTRTPPTLMKVNSWIDTLGQPDKKDESDRDSSPDFIGFDLNGSPNHQYDLISNKSCPNEDKLIEDELTQYCNDYVYSDDEIFIKSRPATRQSKFSNLIEKDLDDCNSILASPENENKKELCKYLQLMKPTDKKSVMILQNRRSKRVKNLSIIHEQKELDKRLRSPDDQTHYSTDKTEKKWLEYKANKFNFPKPPENIDVINFDGIAEENWFKEWSEAAKKRPVRTAIKRKSNVSAEDIMLDESSQLEKKIRVTTRRQSAAKINRSESRGPTKNRSVGQRDTSESRDSTQFRSPRLVRSKSRNSNRRKIISESTNITSKFNGGFKEKANNMQEEIEENKDLINIKTRAMKPIVEDNKIKKKLSRLVLTDSTQTVKEDNKAIKAIVITNSSHSPKKSRSTSSLPNLRVRANKDNKRTKPVRKVNNSSNKSKIGFKIKSPGYKLRAQTRPRKNNSKTAAKSALDKKASNNLTINESEFETKAKAIQECINLSKTENSPEVYLSDGCPEVEQETPLIFGSQLKNLESWPRSSQILDRIISASSTTTTKTVYFLDSDQFNGVSKIQDIETEPKEKRQFYSQILNVQKTSDEDSDEEPLKKSCSTPRPTQLISFDKINNIVSLPKQIMGMDGANAKKHQENENSINLNTRNGSILKIFYVDFDLVLCQELAVSFWNQSAPGNVLGVHNMWTNKGSIRRQVMNNNCTLKESLEMVAGNYFSLAYIELWTKEHESYQQEVPVTNVYAIAYFWQKQYNGLVKKVLQLENINGFADDVQYSVVKSSPKIVVSWHFTGNEMDRKKTYVYCYQVASDFQSICNIEKFEAVDHYVSSLHNIEGCDTLIMGCGENKITLWNIEGGRLAATIEMAEIKSPLATLWVKCDRGFLFTLQQCVDRELRLIAIHSMNHSWKRLASYAPPEVYDRLKGVCVENGIVLAYYDQGIVCWNAGTQEIVVEAAARKETEYISGKYLISIVNNEVNVRHAITSLLDVGYWN